MSPHAFHSEQQYCYSLASHSVWLIPYSEFGQLLRAAAGCVVNLHAWYISEGLKLMQQKILSLFPSSFLFIARILVKPVSSYKGVHRAFKGTGHKLLIANLMPKFKA